MLAAFDDNHYIIPFSQVISISNSNYTELRIQSDNKTWTLYYPNQDVRDLETKRFKQWLTIPTNSI